MALIITVFYLCGIAAAIHAIMTVRTAPGAIAWSVSLVSIPFVAVPAYLVLGRNKFEGTVEAYDESADQLDELMERFRTNMEPWKVEPEDHPSVYQAVRKLSGVEMTHGNIAELLINGDATFDSIIAGVARARDYVLFQFYMFHDDGLGKRTRRSRFETGRGQSQRARTGRDRRSRSLPRSARRACR